MNRAHRLRSITIGLGIVELRYNKSHLEDHSDDHLAVKIVEKTKIICKQIFHFDLLYTFNILGGLK